MSYQYANFKENPCVGTDESTPLNFKSLGEKELQIFIFLLLSCMLYLRCSVRNLLTGRSKSIKKLYEEIFSKTKTSFRQEGTHNICWVWGVLAWVHYMIPLLICTCRLVQVLSGSLPRTPHVGSPYGTRQKLVLLYLCSILLAQSYAPEPNPGPPPVKFPWCYLS